jgi:hypothetical protein
MARGALKAALLAAVAHSGASVQLQGKSLPIAGYELAQDPFTDLIATKTLPPVMMFAHGCSMTTAGVDVLRHLLAVHGIKPSNTGHGELMKSLDRAESIEGLRPIMGAFGSAGDVKGVMDTEDRMERFKIVYEWAKSVNQTLVFKNELDVAQREPELMKYMALINSTAFFFKRQNLIDLMRCMVNDFCERVSGIGMLVNENGTPKDCAFRGRGNNETSESLVWLNPDTILEHLNYTDQQDQAHMDLLMKYGLDSVGEPMSAEKLFAFEQGDLYHSTQEWVKLLNAMGVEADSHVIYDVLQSYGQFPGPANHTETLYDFHSLEKKLRGTRYHDMLRM